MNLLGAKKIRTETLPIIVENRVVPQLLGGLLQAMSGGSIQQKQSFLTNNSRSLFDSRTRSCRTIQAYSA